jgi:serine phosphatase RsbU (regulator of sigma subunit)
MFDLYQQIFFTTLALAFGVLHLSLYAYNRSFKSNLYFALFLFLYGLSIFFDFQRLLQAQGAYNNLYLSIHHAVMPLRSIAGLLFIYSVFGRKPGRTFWIISAGLILSAVPATIDFNWFNLLLLWVFAYMVEALRVLITAVRGHKDGALILSAGFLLLFILSMYDLALDFKIVPPVFNMTNGYQFGFGFLIVSASVFLASHMARMNRTILETERRSKEDEIQRRLLQEADDRKSRELQEAKNLQLAMLPRCDSGLHGLDICFDMKTASEVGGDYYDYLEAADGSLIITLGDATGHGMKAGIMVSVIKSLFVTQAAGMDFPAFFNRCSQTIRKMNLGRLYMTMLLLKIKDNKLTLSMAGMPPLFIYNQADGTMTEWAVKGVPLGAVQSFPYQTEEIELKAHDVILLMSDGLPELFNNQNETLDYPRIGAALREAARRPATVISQELFALADNWRGSRPQNDDITLVVIKT